MFFLRTIAYDPFQPFRFGELKQDPSKALKPHHRPKNSQEFAEKYLQGYYSVIPGSDDDHGVVDADARADSKSSHK